MRIQIPLLVLLLLLELGEAFQRSTTQICRTAAVSSGPHRLHSRLLRPSLDFRSVSSPLDDDQLSMTLYASSGGDSFEDSSVDNEDANSKNRVISSVQRIASATNLWAQKVLVWQRTKRRSLLVAGALAFSVLFAAHHVAPSQTAHHQQQMNRAATPRTELVVKHSRWARGGGAASRTSSSSSSTNKKLSTMLKRDVEKGVSTATRETGRTLRDAANDLGKYMQGPKSDTLILLLATSLVTPLCKKLGTSPILGFLASGMLLGPNGCGLISGIHTTETLAELGIVFFLFEMGIELSVERLLNMRKDVFGLGFSQFIVTALGIAGIGGLVGLPANALVVLGGGLALSSSAFVLQLLKDKNQLATRFGKASFGILLFQDLAVVPLLVVTPILAGGGGGLAAALGNAVVKAALALGSIAFAGKVIMNPLFKTVASAQSQEAFLGVILLTVLSMSFMTEGLGLSNTLGTYMSNVEVDFLSSCRSNDRVIATTRQTLRVDLASLTRSILLFSARSLFPGAFLAGK